MTLKLFISHSSHTEDTRKLRDTVANHLDAQPGVEVLWDSDIKPGDRWRTQLDKWLAECNGGVVLFSQDAVDSAWVLKEAQILTWRRAVVEHFPLVPVLLEPVEPKQTGLADWQPVRINEIQFLQGPNPASMNDGSRLSLAKKVARAVRDQAGETDFGSLDDPLAKWLRNLARGLSKAGAKELKRAALTLGISAGSVPTEDPDAWAWLVARRFLHFGCSPPVVAGDAKETFEKAADILKEITQDFLKEQKERIATQFFPVWVNPDAARHICPSAVAGMAVGINAEYWETGREYADRATLGMASECKCIVAVPDIHDGDPGGIWQRYDAELKRKFALHGVEPSDWSSKEQTERWNRELKDVIRERGSIFIVLYGAGCAPTVVQKLREKYAPFFVILMLGERTTDTAGLDLGKVRLLDPILPARREAKVRRRYEQLL